MNSRSFDLGDVLSVTHGRLLSPRHIEGLYDILGWMTGDKLFTHQLPRAGRACEAPLLAQHPDLAAIVVPAEINTEESLLLWLVGVKTLYGDTRDVEPLTSWEHEDPIEEACNIVGAERVFVIPGGVE